MLVLFIVTFLDAAVHQSFFVWTERFLTGKVGKHELPAAVEFVDELPRTTVGKLSRHELRQQQKPS